MWTMRTMSQLAVGTPSSGVTEQLAAGGAAPFIIGVVLVLSFVGLGLRFLRRGGGSL